MRSLISNLGKKILPLAAISIISSNPLVYGENFSFEAMPINFNYNVESRLKQDKNEMWGFSHGLNFDRSNKIITIEDSDSFKWDLDGDGIIMKNKDGKEILISELLGEGFYNYSLKEVENILFDVVSGKTEIKDIVLSDSGVTINDISKFLNDLGAITQINQQKNSFESYFNIKGIAKMDSSISTEQLFEENNSKFEITRGVKAEGLVVGDAYFRFNTNQNKTITLEDIIFWNSYEGNICVKGCYDYSVYKTLEHFSQFKGDFLTVGVLQKESEIYREKLCTEFSIGIKTDFKDFSAEKSSKKEEFKSTEKIDSRLFYRIMNFDKFLIMTGINQEEIHKTSEKSIEKSSDYLNIEDNESLEEKKFFKIDKRESKNKLIYGLVFKNKIFSYPELKTSASLFGHFTNFKKRNSFGMFFNNPYLNFKLDYNEDCEISREFFLTLFPNKNDFYNYFNEEIVNKINPIENHLESALHNKMLEKSKGVFLVYSQKDGIEKNGGFVSFGERSYFEFGNFISEKNKGHYFNGGFDHFKMGMSKEYYFNSEIHGEKDKIWISYLVNGHLNFRLEKKQDEFAIDQIEISYSANYDSLTKGLGKIIQKFIDFK